MTAREALRRAQGTLACLATYTTKQPGCVVPDPNPVALDAHTHAEWASMQLDGFTVAQVTRAERDLAREGQP